MGSLPRYTEFTVGAKSEPENVSMGEEALYVNFEERTDFDRQSRLKLNQ